MRIGFVSVQVPCPVKTGTVYYIVHCGAYICGHRQVVRHQLPKLTFAGSSPVARSRILTAPHSAVFSWRYTEFHYQKSALYL